jgi:hypothetical protein
LFFTTTTCLNWISVEVFYGQVRLGVYPATTAMSWQLSAIRPQGKPWKVLVCQPAYDARVGISDDWRTYSSWSSNSSDFQFAQALNLQVRSYFL